ncbi:hypothetical protein ACQ4M3_40690 [Leptolyngbya sp. AN03gr2]|uniref:hypothetical protein n=1 Tax=unclassified Leptolyngbya TaxID=2650499 RepID=UPI003D3104B9
MIHHISIAALYPQHVAEVLAELCQGQAMPFPYHEGSYIVLTFDSHGTLIEVHPQGTELKPIGEIKLPPCEQGSRYTAFHAAVSVSTSEAQIHQIAQREGWQVQTCDREGFFQVIEVWIENQQLLEFLPPTFATQYLAFTHPDALKQFLSMAAA